MKSEYEQQAEAFLNATKTAFKCEFLRHGKHFIDDKDTRDIYKAEKIYNAVLDEWRNVCALFTDEEIEQLQEIN